jgi:phospholipase/carboxylesterase
MKKLILVICLIIGVLLNATAQLRQDLALKYLVQLPAEKTAKPPAIILLHGYGSNEQDLFELRSSFPKNYLIVSARAPYLVGTNGYQWFNLNGTDQQAQINNSRELILKLLAQLNSKYNVDPKEVYVMGFSQGAMMSYEVGLTHPELIKGIGVLSGRLFPSLKQEIKTSADLKKLKIFISHGTADERIKFAEGKEASDYLKSIGLKPEFHAYAGMGHAISSDAMRDLIRWLK